MAADRNCTYKPVAACRALVTRYLNCINTSVSVTDTNQLISCLELCGYWLWEAWRIINGKAKNLNLNLTYLF